MKISTKGLLVVSIPLVVWLIFVFVLIGLQSEAERISQEETRSKTVFLYLGGLSKRVVDIGNSLLLYSVTRSEEVKDRIHESQQLIKHDLKKLHSLMRPTPAEEELFQQLTNDCNEIIELSNTIENNILGEEIGWGRLSGLKEVKYVLTKMIGHIRDIEMAENKYDSKTSTLSVKLKSLVKYWLYVGIGLNVLISLAFAMFFSKNITNRLLTLVHNTELFASGKDLKPILAGADEISLLDRRFHEMADALAESMRKERILVDKAADMICSVDPQGSFSRVNQASERLLGYRSDELIGNPLTSIESPDEASTSLNANLQSCKNNEDRIVSFESRLKHRHGYPVFTQWSVYWSEPDESFLCVVRDVSEQVKTEQLKQDFVNMISHDIRSPLNSVQGFLEILNEGIYGQLSAKGTDSANSIRRGLRHLQSLLDDLLDIEKMDAGKLRISSENLDINDIVSGSLDLVSGFADLQGIKIVTDGMDALKLPGDRQRLIQVVQNILNNAIKFSPSGSTISIGTRQKGNNIELVIADQGEGISKDDLPHLFDRFWQVEGNKRASRVGSGLGLAICQAIINLHGGKITVESELGHGTSFCIILPCHTLVEESRETING